MNKIVRRDKPRLSQRFAPGLGVCGWHCKSAGSKTAYVALHAKDAYCFWLSRQSYTKRRRILESLPFDKREEIVKLVLTFK